ncbi:hypothetical protein CXG81DRAFT_13551 [Caulochytrium protostelioides]|uniref:ABC-type uncharacterized transport system domain-containing protein n=1 Tax=Caulochytrium protostelioides TaxID=1555241 RepID=A0A4P9X515_9FUNG|nr:hypothetical protein CXG81DRAFT_13551 [Caulochytrium protostelioides]|eukprot:RKP00175.1 hypothetical protein CXG81DRAFT_13551 [Caulochytrium protostelioides]
MAAKRETATLASGLKVFGAALRTRFHVQAYKDALALEKLRGATLLIFGSPREPLSMAEFAMLQAYLAQGGAILFLSEEGGEPQTNTNFNYLLEELGIIVNPDGVVRATYGGTYFHPKESLITRGILNREISRVAGKQPRRPDAAATGGDGDADPLAQGDDGSLAFVYPFGATLTAVKPAVALLSTSTDCFPVSVPVGAVHMTPNAGKVMVLGSVQMLMDAYVEKEDNLLLGTTLVELLTSPQLSLNTLDAQDPDLADYHTVPDIASLSRSLRACLQDNDEIPRDFTALFDTHIFRFNTTLVPEVLKAYPKLGLKKEPLTLIQPQFEVPLPPLEPATFTPTLTDLDPPQLELFDLDSAFASQRTRIAQVTNKCTDADVEYYVQACGRILGVTAHLQKERQRQLAATAAAHDDTSSPAVVAPAPTPAEILHFVFQAIVDWKKSD